MEDLLGTFFIWLLFFVALLLSTKPLLLELPSLVSMWPTVGFWIPESIVIKFLARAIIAVPIAYFARRRGYSWWGFFLAAWLFMPAASIAMLIALPRIKNGRVARPKES